MKQTILVMYQFRQQFKMRLRLITISLIFSFCTTPPFIFGQVSAKKIVNKNQVKKTHNLRYDTSKTAIIELNKNSKWPFNNSFKASFLTQDELQIVDSILLKCVANYNNSLDQEHKQWSIDLKKYNFRKQLVVVTNKKGEKEVWVNCFCSIPPNIDWKIKGFIAEDGGNCYFNFKINIASKNYYDLTVNGSA